LLLSRTINRIAGTKFDLPIIVFSPVVVEIRNNETTNNKQQTVNACKVLALNRHLTRGSNLTTAAEKKKKREAKKALYYTRKKI